MVPANNNLETFRILYIIKGILTLLFSFFPLLYVFVGGIIFSAEEFNHLDHDIPFNIGAVFMSIGVFVFVMMIVFGILTLLVAPMIKNRRNYTFILVIAVLNCLTGILGILLGVFTIVELNKPEVKELFGTPQSLLRSDSSPTA